MNKTGIEYLTHTWNPIAMRCTKISEACEHCWHIQMCDRLAANFNLPMNIREAYARDRVPVLISERLSAPLKRKKPFRIGVQFMGDLGHEDIPFETIASIFGMMAFCQNHTFMVLTKRPNRMGEFFSRFHDGDYIRNLNWWYNEACTLLPKKATFGIRLRPKPKSLPLPNVWLGVTAENQQRADARIPVLLQIPAAVRFLSLEPLLGEMDIRPYLKSPAGYKLLSHFYGPAGFDPKGKQQEREKPRISWVICGGLSLPGGKIKPPKREWVASILEQCDEAGVPVFIKENCLYPEVRREFPKGG